MLTRVSLIYRTEPTTKKWDNRKTKKIKKMDMLKSRPIGKQSGESEESVRKKKRKVTVGRLAEKESFKLGMKK